MRVLGILQRPGISHRAIDRLRQAHTYPWCVRLLNTPRLLSLRIQIKRLTVSNPLNAAQHLLLTATTAARVAFHLCLLIWTGLLCSQGAGYAISACFIRYIEVKSTSPFSILSQWPYLRPCLCMAVQGRVATVRSVSLPLQTTLTNTLSMWDQSLHGTRYQLTLLVRHLIQNLSEKCPLL